MAICPTCGVESPDGVRFCPKDGTALGPGSAAPGSLIGSMVDRYRIIGRLGEGGMGTVYRAEHTHLGRQVALKLLHPELARSGAVLDRFFREARAASEVKSPHIVEVTDFGTTADGRSFLVMELLDGISLRDLLDKSQGQRLPPARAIGIAVQIAEALGAAHQRGVVHRDLKPANVLLLERDGTTDFVKIFDFGIAKLNEKGSAQLTQTGMIMGSPTYMAPEQASGRPVDGRADLYSLGVILYEMLVGSPPFAGDGPTTVLLAQMSETPEPPRARNPDVPEALEALILRCLAKNPEERPRDLLVVGAALQAWQDGRVEEMRALLDSPADASITMAAGPAALARKASTTLPPGSRDSQASMPPVGGALAAVPNTPTGLVMPAPSRRRTGIFLTALVLGVAGGVALTLHLLGISPYALLGPLGDRIFRNTPSRSMPVATRDARSTTVKEQPAIEERPDAAPVVVVTPPTRSDARAPDQAQPVKPPPPVDARVPAPAGRAPDAGDDDDDDLKLDDDDDDDDETSPAHPVSTKPAITPPSKTPKTGKKTVKPPAKKHHSRLTAKQIAHRRALKARIRAQHAHLKKLLRAHRISQAHYRRAVAQLKQRYRRAIR